MAKTVLTPKIIKLMVGFGNYLSSEERKSLFQSQKTHHLLQKDLNWYTITTSQTS